MPSQIVRKTSRSRRPITPAGVFGLSFVGILAVMSQAAFAQTPTATPGDKQALITWSTVPSATGYNVYQSTTNGSGYSKITTSAPSVANAYVSTGLTNGTTYYYVVTAIVGGVEGSYSTQTSAAPLAQDGNWVATPPSPGLNPLPVIGTNTASFSTSANTTLVASASVTGSTTSTVSSTSEAQSSGTWTFTWTGTAWPSLYTITSTVNEIFVASVNAGTGTATVAATGGSTEVSATFPTSATPGTALPTETVTFNTTDLTNPALTTNSYQSIAGYLTAPGTTSGAFTGWSDNLIDLQQTLTAYTGTWFQNNFATPSQIVLTFTPTAEDQTVSGSLSSSTSNGIASASATYGYMYIGQ